MCRRLWANLQGKLPSFGKRHAAPLSALAAPRCLPALPRARWRSRRPTGSRRLAGLKRLAGHRRGRAAGCRCCCLAAGPQSCWREVQHRRPHPTHPAGTAGVHRCRTLARPPGCRVARARRRYYYSRCRRPGRWRRWRARLAPPCQPEAHPAAARTRMQSMRGHAMRASSYSPGMPADQVAPYPHR